MMEDVSWRFKIAVTTFHINYTRPMPRYYFSPLESKTTTCHVASSASRPSLNAVYTSSTAISQLNASVDIAYVYSPPLLLSAVYYLSSTSYFSLFLSAASHSFRCSAHIPEVPPER